MGIVSCSAYDNPVYFLSVKYETYFRLPSHTAHCFCHFSYLWVFWNLRCVSNWSWRAYLEARDNRNPVQHCPVPLQCFHKIEGNQGHCHVKIIRSSTQYTWHLVETGGRGEYLMQGSQWRVCQLQFFLNISNENYMWIIPLVLSLKNRGHNNALLNASSEKECLSKAPKEGRK